MLLGGFQSQEIGTTLFKWEFQPTTHRSFEHVRISKRLFDLPWILRVRWNNVTRRRRLQKEKTNSYLLTASNKNG